MVYIKHRKNRLYNVKTEDYDALSAFLMDLGVRSRIVMKAENRMIIEAENPYRIWSKPTADEMMTAEEVRKYQS